LFGVGGGTFLIVGGDREAVLFAFREGKEGGTEGVLDVRFGICGGTAFVFVREGNGGALDVRFGREGGDVVSEFVLPMFFGIAFLSGN